MKITVDLEYERVKQLRHLARHVFPGASEAEIIGFAIGNLDVLTDHQSKKYGWEIRLHYGKDAESQVHDVREWYEAKEGGSGDADLSDEDEDE